MVNEGAVNVEKARFNVPLHHSLLIFFHYQVGAFIHVPAAQGQQQIPRPRVGHGIVRCLGEPFKPHAARHLLRQIRRLDAVDVLLPHRQNLCQYQVVGDSQGLGEIL